MSLMINYTHMLDSSSTSDARVTETDAHPFPPRGHGHIQHQGTTYYYWYRARGDMWYMGVHTTKPVHNFLHHTDDYDGPQVFHHTTTHAPHIQSHDVPTLLCTSVDAFVASLDMPTT